MKNLGNLFKYIIPYKRYAVLNILFNILGILSSVFSVYMLIPFLGILFGTQPMIDKPVEFDITHINQYITYLFSNYIKLYGHFTTLIIVSIMSVLFSFLKNLFTYLANHYMTPMRVGVVKDIRNKMYDKILRLPFSYFTSERKGDIIARMTNDVQEIELSVMSSLEMLFRDPLKIIIFLMVLFFMNAKITIFVLILLPISGLIIGRLGRTLRHKSFKSQTKLGTLISSIEETLSGLRIIKAFNAERNVNTRFQTINEDYSKLNIKINRRRYMASPLSEFLGTSVMVVIMVYGASIILNHQSDMKPQDFIGFLSIFFLIIEPAKSFSTAYYNIQKGMASAERVDVILKAENKIKEKKDAITKPFFENSIEYCNVTFKYDRVDVLKNINLKIEKGKTVALVGQSGSGKSTLVDLLPRFWDIEHGEILIDGINIKDLKIKDLRDLMGIVNQEPILFNDTFFNNIAFGRENASESEVIAAAKVAHAHEFISTTKDQYNHNIGDRGGKLSGGQRQRISIARAVLKNPPILILDEATSALDTESERLVQDALINLMKNRTTIVIAHRLSTVIHADEICVLHEGQIVERGKHEELLALNGVYKRLHDIQMFSANE